MFLFLPRAEYFPCKDSCFILKLFPSLYFSIKIALSIMELWWWLLDFLKDHSLEKPSKSLYFGSFLAQVICVQNHCLQHSPNHGI